MHTYLCRLKWVIFYLQKKTIRIENSKSVLACQNDIEANEHGQWSYGRRQINIFIVYGLQIFVYVYMGAHVYIQCL